MDWLDFTLDVVKIVLPSLAVFGAVYYVLKQYLDNEFRKSQLELRKHTRKDTMPVKMQAYERMILFLDRITPSNMVVRMTDPSHSAAQLKNTLVSAINEEYNHNIAQQLYISPQGWQVVKVVKDQVLAIISHCYKEMDSDAGAVDLSKAILDYIIKSEESPTDKGIDFLKKEFKLVFD